MCPAQLASNATNIHVPCPNATQRFPDQDLRSQCSMGDDACVYYCRCCGELATDEETSWQADKQKQTPLNFVIAAKSWISGSCLRLLLSRFYYCCSLSAGQWSQKKKSNSKLYLAAVANTDRRWDRLINNQRVLSVDCNFISLSKKYKTTIIDALESQTIYIFDQYYRKHCSFISLSKKHFSLVIYFLN